MMINFIQRVTFAALIAGACVSTIAASELEPANPLDNKGKQATRAFFTTEAGLRMLKIRVSQPGFLTSG